MQINILEKISEEDHRNIFYDSTRFNLVSKDQA